MAASFHARLLAGFFLFILACGVQGDLETGTNSAASGAAGAFTRTAFAANSPDKVLVYRYLQAGDVSHSDRISLANAERDGIAFRLARLPSAACDIPVYEGISRSGRHFATVRAGESATAAPHVIGYCCGDSAADKALVRLRNAATGETALVAAREVSALAASGYNDAASASPCGEAQ